MKSIIRISLVLLVSVICLSKVYLVSHLTDHCERIGIELQIDTDGDSTDNDIRIIPENTASFYSLWQQLQLNRKLHFNIVSNTTSIMHFVLSSGYHRLVYPPPNQ